MFQRAGIRLAAVVREPSAGELFDCLRMATVEDDGRHKPVPRG